MTAHTDFHVRSAASTTEDVDFIVAAFDSTLPYLASVGSGEMWGSEPFSLREGFREDIVKTIEASKVDENSDARRLLIAERNDESGTFTRTAAAVIRDSLPEYLLERPELAGHVAKATSLLFIEVLISDYRAGAQRKGAGAALIHAIKRRAIHKGIETLYVDAWAGNEKKLNRYYENLGFSYVEDFGLQRRNGSTWPGTLYRMDLTTLVDAAHQ